MGNRRKGQLTADSERHKHLRPYSKRKFWKGERKAGKEHIEEDKESSITLYKYNYRPGYGSDHLLIQISIDFDERAKFISDLERTLNTLKAKVKFIEDRIPINDDLVYSLETINSQFDMDINIWGLCFILGEDKQEELSQIEKILDLSPLFVKEEVDFEDYKILDQD